MDEHALETLPPFLSLPNLTAQELEELKYYWDVYEAHREALIAEFLRTARGRAGFQHILQNGFFFNPESGENSAIEIQRRAIFQGEWAPFLNELRREGVLYAQAGLSFSLWLKVVGISRKSLVPFLVEAYNGMPQQLSSAINGMNLFFNLVIAVLGEGYLWGKEQLIHHQKESLQERQGQLAGLLNSAMDAIIIIDENQDILNFNPAAEKMFGYSVAEVRGHPLTMLIPERLRNKHASDMRAFGKTATTKRNMGRLGMVFGLRANGEEFPLEVSISQNENSAGKTFTAILRDISERYQSEKNLRASEERFRLVVEAAPSAMLVVDRSGEIVLANARAQSLFGYTVEELLGKRIEFLVPERYRAGHIKFREAFLYQPVGRPMGAGRDLYGLHKDGREIPIEIGLTPYQSSNETFTLALIVDITERKRAEQALRASEQLYHSTLDNMLEGVQIVDFEWRYRYVNEAVIQQGRETRDRLIGRRMSEVYPGIENTEMFAVLQRCMRERTSERMENEFTYPDGDTRWFELSIQPIPEGLFVLSIDVTERKRAEQALRLENQRFLRFANSNIVGIAIASATGKILFANDYYLDLLGVTRQDFLKGEVDWRKFTPPEWLPADEQALRELRERGVCEPYEKEYLRPDGRRVSVYIANAMLPGPDEQIAAFVLNMTERKQAEEDLRESEEKLRLFIEHAPASLAMFDREMRYLAVSRRWMIDYGLPEQNILGKSHYQVFPEIPDRWKVAHQRGLDGEVVSSSEDEFIRLDGTVQWLRWEVRPWHTSDGAVGGIVIFTEDISENKHAEDALRESEERFRKAVIDAPMPSLMHDEDGRNIEISKGWTHFSGYTLEDIPTIEDWAQKAYGEKSGFAKEYIDHLFEISETVSNGEWVIKTKTGEQRVWDFYTTPIGLSREGKRILLSTAVDVTERNQAEEAARQWNEVLEQRVKFRTAELEAANKELEAFSYSVSHDLRAPLRSIDGFSLALLEDYADQLPEEGQDYLVRVRAATQNMAQLIDDLLNLSRVSRSPMQRSEVDLSAMASSIADDLRQKEPERTVNVSIQPGLAVQADERLMKVVLENLLNNAWKFTSKQKDAFIEFGAQDNEEGRVFYVRDNGSGFDMAYADKLFGAFQRLHSVSDFPGTGVGLATVQRIINRHGGRIWTKAAMNQGATFYFIV